jgi:hypothetical protein
MSRSGAGQIVAGVVGGLAGLLDCHFAADYIHAAGETEIARERFAGKRVQMEDFSPAAARCGD